MIPIKFNPLGRNAGNPYFEVTIDTTASSLVWGFRCAWNSGGYCRVADWGDGSGEDVTQQNTWITHTYASAGRWTVKFIGNVTNWNVTGYTYGPLVHDTNANWSALGSDLQNISFTNCTKAVFNFGNIPSINQFSLWEAKLATCPITRIPDTIGRQTPQYVMSQMFQDCKNMRLLITQLPHTGFGTLGYAFFNTLMATIDLNAIAGNAPAGGWTACTNLANSFPYAGSGNTPGTCTGSVATFLRKFPNVTNVTNAFTNTNTTSFSSTTVDYCSFTFTTTSANQAWGFTPTSSAGRWYVFDWGDGTAVTANKNLDVFTSGTRIEHTFATPGTYTVKLAMNASAIALDAYDATNGKWEMLGNPTH